MKLRCSDGCTNDAVLMHQATRGFVIQPFIYCIPGLDRTVYADSSGIPIGATQAEKNYIDAWPLLPDCACCGEPAEDIEAVRVRSMYLDEDGRCCDNPEYCDQPEDVS